MSSSLSRNFQRKIDGKPFGRSDIGASSGGRYWVHLTAVRRAVKRISAPADAVRFVAEKGRRDLELHFKSILEDPTALIVARLDGKEKIIEDSTITEIRSNSKPLIDVYMLTANRLYFRSFELSVDSNLGVTIDRSSVVALRWELEDVRELMDVCETG